MAEQELLVDFIISLDGYAAAEGWPGWWGLEGPEYLAWLGQQPEREYGLAGNLPDQAFLRERLDPDCHGCSKHDAIPGWPYA